jgi:cell division protein FtsN
MAKARRSGGGKKKSRWFLWLVLGLVLGAGVMYVAQRYAFRDGKAFSGIASLFKSEKKPAEKTDEKKPEEKAKPKLDFYTILPGESILPDTRRDDRKTTKAEPAEKGVSYLLQAAAYASAEDADRLKAKLALNGLEANIEKVTVGDKGTHYRVRLGPYSKIEDLDAANARLSQLGIKALRIKVKKAAG